MASSSSVLQDNSWLSRADRALLPVERVFALISGLAVFSLMFPCGLFCFRPKIFKSAFEWLC